MKKEHDKMEKLMNQLFSKITDVLKTSDYLDVLKTSDYLEKKIDTEWERYTNQEKRSEPTEQEIKDKKEKEYNASCKKRWFDKLFITITDMADWNHNWDYEPGLEPAMESILKNMSVCERFDLSNHLRKISDMIISLYFKDDKKN